MDLTFHMLFASATKLVGYATTNKNELNTQTQHYEYSFKRPKKSRDLDNPRYSRPPSHTKPSHPTLAWGANPLVIAHLSPALKYLLQCFKCRLNEFHLFYFHEPVQLNTFTKAVTLDRDVTDICIHQGKTLQHLTAILLGYLYSALAHRYVATTLRYT